MFRHLNPVVKDGSNLRDISAHLRLLESPFMQNMFPRAIHILAVTTPSESADARARELWNWVQAAKCRGIRSVGKFRNLDSRYSLAFLEKTSDFNVEGAYDIRSTVATGQTGESFGLRDLQLIQKLYSWIGIPISTTENLAHLC